MNTDSTASQYAQRGIRDLGQQAHDSERCLIWAWDHPARYPIEKVRGERVRPIYHSQQVFACLLTIAKAKSIETGEQYTVEDVCESLLSRAVKELAPNAWELHERHRAESKALLEAMSYNGAKEPDLQLGDPANERP